MTAKLDCAIALLVFLSALSAASSAEQNLASRAGVQSAGAPSLVASPDMILFDLVQGGVSDPESTVVTISAENTTTPVGALSVSGVPAWLSARPSSTGKAIVNTINTAALTTLGTFEATITVSDAGTGLRTTYLATINYRAPEVNPISVKQPNATTRLKVGDTLKVIYTADCVKVASVTVNLSVNDGEDYVRLHQGNSLECGIDRTLAWRITDSITIDAVKVPVASANCIIAVRSYNGPEYAFSQVFAIDPWSSVLPRHAGRRTLAGSEGLRAAGAGPLYRIDGRRIAAEAAAGQSQVPTRPAPGVAIQGRSDEGQ